MNSIYPITITYGRKPNNLDFLEDTITDLNKVLMNGIFIKNSSCNILNKKPKFVLKNIVCDAPAKSFAIGTK